MNDIIREGDEVLVRGGVHAIVEEVAVSNGLPTKYKVRVTKGQEYAGTVMWVTPADISQIDHTEQVDEIPLQIEDVPAGYQASDTMFQKVSRIILEHGVNIVIGFVVVVIAITILSRNEAPPEPSQIMKQTIELNGINILDSQDLEIKRAAQSRIDTRKPRKDELLNSIGYGK